MSATWCGFQPGPITNRPQLNKLPQFAWTQLCCTVGQDGILRPIGNRPCSQLIACLAILFAHSLTAQNMLRPPTNPPSNVRPAALKDVGIDQKLNGRLPLDLHFRDETGRDVCLGEFFSTRAVIVTPVYYGCPMLCTQILNGLVSGLNPLIFNAGQQYDVVALSFEPSETPDLALKKKDSYVNPSCRPASARG